MNNFISGIRKNSNSIYFTDAVTRLTHISKNKRYNQIRNMFLANDPVIDFEGYLKILESIRPELDAGEVRPHYVGCENECYGHFRALQDYCGYHCASRGMIMEHGVNFSVSLPSKVNMDETFALFFQSNYKNKMIHKSNPMKLTFSIGPYIHYAAPLYKQSDMLRMKEKWGRVVLVYLSHSTYKESILRNYNAYQEYVEKYSEKYDTVLFCVYWRDVNRELYDVIQTIPKAAIVSAGFLYDPSFIRRTKSLMQLADIVVADEIGTSVGYALYMNKKVDVINSRDSRILDPTDPQIIMCLKNQKRVENALISGEPEKIKAVYEEFWGGSYIKAQEEMRDILEGLNEICTRCKGKKDRFVKTVEEKITEWEKNDSSKYKLFKSALG